MDETRHEHEQRVEIADLNAEIKMLRARAKEDRKHAQRKLEMEIHLATHKDVLELEAQIDALKAELAEGDKVIDRIVVVMRRRAAEDDSLEGDMP